MSNTEPAIEIRTHRFHDRIAISIDDGPTRYLTGEQCMHLARRLLRGADDIHNVPFTASTYPVETLTRTDAPVIDERA